MIDKALLVAFRCEYYRKKGITPPDDATLWRFIAEYIAAAFWEFEEDTYNNCCETLFDKNANLMASLYPADFAAIKADEELAWIYFNKNK
jgi:hypothetical protein